MAHDTDGGAFSADNARQMIETASAFAQREMLPEARQALQRARNALAERSDVGPAHWCNASLVALEIAARGGDVQGMEAEAAQLHSLSGGGQYWSEQARARIARSSGRVDPARLDRVFAVLGGAEPVTPRPAAPPTRPEGAGRGLISPTSRPSAPPEPPRAEGAPEPAPDAVAAPPADTFPARAAEPGEAHPADSARERGEPATSATPVPPHAELPPTPREAPTGPPRASDPERAFWGAVWGAWQGSAPGKPPSGRLPAESIPTSAPHADLSPALQEQAADGWMVRLAEPANDDLPLILVDDGPGLVDARLRVTPDRTDAPELLRSFVDHMTRWRDDVSDEEAENFYDLGTSFLDMEQWDSAVKVFDQAMRSPATRVAAAEGYLQALMGMGDHHAAFGAAGMALGNLAAAGEPLSGILFLRGRAAEGIGDPREARRCYREALRIDHFYADARERLAALGE